MKEQYPVRYVSMAVQVYEPRTELGVRVLNNAKLNDIGFENLNNTTNGENLKIFKRKIYKIDTSKTDEEIYIVF